MPVLPPLVLEHPRPPEVGPVVDAASRTWSPSHRRLLTRVEADPRASAVGGPDAVVMPTSRGMDEPRSGLRFAADLALLRGSPLVLLCSKEAAREDHVQRLRVSLRRHAREGLDVLVVRPGGALLRETTFRVDQLPVSRFQRDLWPGSPTARPVNDVGRKRNLGLLLAAAMGWETVLLLDDDVRAFDDRPQDRGLWERTLDTLSLDAALRALPHHSAVGWTSRHYDDNSVVCRIRGAMGHDQHQFIGGGALLVAATVDASFFPSIYNEDWLFLLGGARCAGRGIRLAEAGDVRQDPYDGLDPARALREELGDILAEGLMAAAESGGGVESDRDFWSSALQDRRALVSDLRGEAEAASGVLASAVTPALTELGRLHRMFETSAAYWAQQLALFDGAWLADHRTWHTRLERARGQSLMPILGATGSVLGPSPSVEHFLGRRRRT